MIELAKADEEKAGRLHQRIQQVLHLFGIRNPESEAEGLFQWIVEYVEFVPHLMEEGLASARDVGLGTEVEKILGAAESYWLEPNDIIPDHQGLLGIVDDAYCSLSLLDGVSRWCRQKTGKSLLIEDFSASNNFARNIIGEPNATDLDRLVRDSIQKMTMADLSKALNKVSSQMEPLVTPDTFTASQNRLLAETRERLAASS
jgi:uncharacterized membrane protein YkvA (DUF1232 family)